MTMPAKRDKIRILIFSPVFTGLNMMHMQMFAHTPAFSTSIPVPFQNLPSKSFPEGAGVKAIVKEYVERRNIVPPLFSIFPMGAFIRAKSSSFGMTGMVVERFTATQTFLFDLFHPCYVMPMGICTPLRAILCCIFPNRRNAIFSSAFLTIKNRASKLSHSPLPLMTPKT
jgi:hypothetical protein